MTKKLHLGCGHKILKGWINVDIIDYPGVDMVLDLNEPWPWENNGIDQILMSHLIEHLDDRNKILREITRILKIGGIVEIHHPHPANPQFYRDTTHKFASTCETYYSLLGSNHRYQQMNLKLKDISLTLFHFPFKIKRKKFILWWENHLYRLTPFSFFTLNNVHVILEKVKKEEQRT